MNLTLLSFSSTLFSGLSFVRRSRVDIYQCQLSKVLGISFYSFMTSRLSLKRSWVDQALSSVVFVANCDKVNGMAYTTNKVFNSALKCVEIMDCTFSQISLPNIAGVCTVSDSQTKMNVTHCLFYECRKGAECSGVFSSGKDLLVSMCCFSNMDNVHISGSNGGTAICGHLNTQTIMMDNSVNNIGGAHSPLHFYQTSSIFKNNNVTDSITISSITYTTGVLYISSTYVECDHNHFARCLNGNTFYPYYSASFTATRLFFINCTCPSGSGILYFIYGSCGIIDSVFINNSPNILHGQSQTYTFTNCIFSTSNILCNPAGIANPVNCQFFTNIIPDRVNNVNTLFCVGQPQETLHHGRLRHNFLLSTVIFILKIH